MRVQVCRHDKNHLSQVHSGCREGEIPPDEYGCHLPKRKYAEVVSQMSYCSGVAIAELDVLVAVYVIQNCWEDVGCGVFHVDATGVHLKFSQVALLEAF
jgi:hypothetical protein